MWPSQTKSPSWSIINFRFISYWCIHATKGVRWSTDHFISTKNNKIDHKLWPCSFECFNTVKCQNFFCICMLFVFVFVLLFVFVSLLVFVFRGRNIVTINVCPTLIYDPASIGLCTFLYLCHPYQIRLIRQISISNIYQSNIQVEIFQQCNQHKTMKLTHKQRLNCGVLLRNHKINLKYLKLRFLTYFGWNVEGFKWWSGMEAQYCFGLILIFGQFIVLLYCERC